MSLGMLTFENKDIHNRVIEEMDISTSGMDFLPFKE